MATGMVNTGFGVSPGGSVDHPELATVIGLGGKNTGVVHTVWLYFGADFGTARLRVAVHTKIGWDIFYVDVDSSQPATWPALPDGATHASVLRVRRNDNDNPNVPICWGTVAQVS